MARQPYMGLGLLVSSRFHDHTLFRHTTVARTPLDEGPARRRDLYLTSHNTHKRQTSMPPLGFEPTILVSERPKTHALDRAARFKYVSEFPLVERESISFVISQKAKSSFKRPKNKYVFISVTHM
jgi:hypothetical protein